MIFFFFKPLEIKERVFKETPIFEFKNFTMYELDTKGLTTKMLGSSAAKYEDRYVVKDINYTDNSPEYKANMVAKNGVFQEKEHTIYLDKNVTYTSLNKNRFVFQTQKATYNTKTSVVVSDTNYTISFDYGYIQGTYIKYNALVNRVFSKNVQAKYTIQ